MAKLYSATGDVLLPDDNERITPVVALDTPEGKFNIPVCVIATFQYTQLVEDIAQKVMEKITERMMLDSSRPKEYTVIDPPPSKETNDLVSS